MEHTNINDAIRLQMLEGIPKNLISGTKYPIYAFNRRTPLQLLSHLSTKYNKITTIKICENDAAMKSTFYLSTEIKLLFKQIGDFVDLMKDNSPYMDHRILDIAYNLM